MSVLQIAAACLVDPHGRLLLVRKRGTEAFMLPGGKREVGESALAAVQRELWEELQLQLNDADLTPLGRFYAAAANEVDTWVDAQVFIAVLRHTVHAAAELEELAWLERDRPYPAHLAPLLRDHVLPALQPLARLLTQDVHTVPTGE